MITKPQGMTLIGMLFSIVAIVFVVIIIMRLVPIYIEHYEIAQSIKSLNLSSSSLSGDPLVDIETLRSNLNKRLDINGVTLKNEDITFTPMGEDRFKIRLKYQAIRFLAYNISLLVNFDDTYEIVIAKNTY